MILEQIKQERDYSQDYIDSKKTKRREDLKQYIREATEDKISINTIYVAIQTLMSIYWNNKLVVKWVGTDRFDREIAKNTNKVMKFDYKEMGIEQLDYVLEYNRLMIGVGVQLADGFDFTSMFPKLKNISSLSCFPDPDGGATIKEHRFFGFETNMTVEEMKEYKFENIDLLGGISIDEELNKQAVDNANGYAGQTDYTDNRKHTVYFHFTRYNKKPYLIATNPDCSFRLKQIELIPVNEEEKKDSSKILYPIGLKYYSYIPGDFFSVSVPDLLRDKQSLQGKLFNALISMAIRNAYGDDRFVNVRAIKDIKGLQQPTIEGKIIPVDLKPGESMNNAVYQVPKDNPGNVPFNVKTYLEETAQLDIGVDRNTSGVLSTQNATLGEREMAQRNANTRFLLATKQGNWFEEFRWKYLWYRSYRANLKSIDEKMVYFDNAYSQTNYVFKKDEFIGTNELRISLVNKAEREQELNAKKADRMALMPQLIAGARSETERTQLYREMLDMQGEDEEMIYNLFPLTKDEIKAYDKLEALNENDMRGTIIDDITEDHYTFIKIFEQAEETKAKERAIQARYNAMAYVGVPMQQENGAENSALNVSSAQLTNNAISQNKGVASLQDITK